MWYNDYAGIRWYSYNLFQNYHSENKYGVIFNARDESRGPCQEGGHMRVSARKNLVTAYLIGWNINEVGGA